MTPYLAEVHMSQQREQLKAAAERYRITHDFTWQSSGRRSGPSGGYRARWNWRAVLVSVR
jgi:hypothetical protein